ncbi:pyridoxal-phosphate-dependent aminotransferase family protein [Seohaeicola zhoushanensis]|uniref:Septum site-determining protein n=1 Tax=Seohaeicola zhoushanensis TaxID=1569283 RepID=A0A8J3H2F1_9RHOB|nr:aminotransferase class V-fold PLP-dependent enzyme [Seohaeicola zhoushanensis]GHF67713.1 septum site-determining protein [Seohaeicola zhoushanensis]
MTRQKTLAAGREYLAIPGPSVIPDAVLQAMHRAAPNIYAGELVDMTHSVVADLRRVARTSQHVAIYIANGHGAWEAALSNVIGPGDRVLVPATGRFAHGWADQCRGLGAETEIIEFGRASTFDLDRIGAALKADTGHRFKAVLATHVDTSSSVRNDIAGLRRVIDECGHPALLMVDCIASLGCDVFEMDAWGVDVMVSACQKGLMVPPGVSFVWFSDRAAEARARMARVSRYWDWAPRANPAEYYQHFGGTAPTHHIFGLRAALDMILGEGMEQVWARHAHLARAVWAACETWGQEGPFALNIADPSLRSHAVTAARLGAPHGTALREWVAGQIGLTLGIGLGMAESNDPAWHGFFRLGHMGHVNGQMIMGMLGGIEAGLCAIGVPHGKGGLEAAAKVLAEG